MLHELWVDGDEGQTFCLAGTHGDDARALLSPAASLAWTVDADSHFEAMTRYYDHMGWGAYRSEHDWDLRSYGAAGIGDGAAQADRQDDGR